MAYVTDKNFKGESTLQRLKSEREVKDIQFPLYLKRCEYFYDKYVNKVIPYVDFWRGIITSGSIYKEGVLNMADTSKEFIFFKGKFIYNFMDIYSEKKILAGIDSYGGSITPKIIQSKYADPEKTVAWNLATHKKSMAKIAREIKDSIKKPVKKWKELK